MLTIREIEDELTIKAFPVVMWSLALGCFAFGAYLDQLYFQVFGGTKLFQGNLIDTLMHVFILTFLPIGGLILFYFSPFIITKINRQKRLVTIIKIGILGRRTEVFNYNALDGGFRVKSEEDEDKNENLKVYFKIKSGRKIYLSSDLSTFGKGKVYDAAMKANEYLQTQKDER